MRFWAFIIALCFPLMASAGEPWTEAELRTFARDLGDYVTAHHIKRDISSPQCGMVYKWYRPSDGKWIQDSRRNMLSDGTWFATGLSFYARATRQWWPLSVLRKYPLAFYTKTLIRSDELFRTSKGICPFWWDDGASVAFDDGSVVKGFASGPKPTSNALAEDLAAMLMSVGQSVEDTDVTLAAAYLLNGDRQHYDEPAVPATLGVAAAVVSGDEPLRMRWFSKRRWQLYEGPGGKPFEALALGVKVPAPAAMDEALREYCMAVAAVPWQPLRESFAKNFIYATYANLRLSDLWHNRGATTHGLPLPDQPPLAIAQRFDYYRGDKADIVFSPRAGASRLCAAAIALQMLDAWPQVWDAWARSQHQEAIRLSEKFTPLQTGAGAVVELAWTPSSLLVRARGPRKLVFKPVAPLTGATATVTLDEQGKASAKAERTLLELTAAPQPDGRVEIEIPFALAKSQKPWLNAVEEGRWSVSLDDESARTVIFQSSVASVRARLAMEVGEGLRFWQKVFKERGYLPGAFTMGKAKSPEAELSDTGAYGFMIAAVAEYIVWLRPERDWELPPAGRGAK